MNSENRNYNMFNKNTLRVVLAGLDTVEEKIGELEEIVIKTIQNKMQRKKAMSRALYTQYN